MIDEIKYFFLGLIQGLTEFFPISSSGHLEIFSHISNIAQEEPLLLFIVVHFATALSTIIVYFEKVKKIIFGLIKRNREDTGFVFKLIISSIPTLLIYFLFNKYIDVLFMNAVNIVCMMLFLTGLILIMTNFISSSDSNITYLHSILMGCAQAIAIIPGISRSGATIATALFCKVNREKAAEFSFLMALIPIIGGVILKIIEFGREGAVFNIEINFLIIAFLSAFLSGLFACKYMILIVKDKNLKYFGYYCIIAACCFWLFI